MQHEQYGLEQNEYKERPVSLEKQKKIGRNESLADA